MKTVSAFICIILIWATTPLAMKWSTIHVGFIFGAMSRMVLGALLSIAAVYLFHNKLSFHKKALTTYAIAAGGIYGAMFCIYWSSQHLSSGLIAVIFGLSPIVTAFLAYFWLGEKSLTVGKLSGVIFGFVGVTIIFQSELFNSYKVIYGVMANLAALLIHASSGIWVKRINPNLPSMEITAGSMIFVAPLFLITWGITDGVMPVEIPLKTAASIIYLGIFGTFISFTLYFFILERVEVSRIALITLVTPVLALFIGQFANNEYVSHSLWLGTAFIVAALVFHTWGDKFLKEIFRNK